MVPNNNERREDESFYTYFSFQDKLFNISKLCVIKLMLFDQVTGKGGNKIRTKHHYLYPPPPFHIFLLPHLWALKNIVTEKPGFQFTCLTFRITVIIIIVSVTHCCQQWSHLFATFFFHLSWYLLGYELFRSLSSSKFEYTIELPLLRVTAANTADRQFYIR